LDVEALHSLVNEGVLLLCIAKSLLPGDQNINSPPITRSSDHICVLRTKISPFSAMHLNQLLAHQMVCITHNVAIQCKAIAVYGYGGQP
jgi:hypothetical protein